MQKLAVVRLGIGLAAMAAVCLLVPAIDTAGPAEAPVWAGLARVAPVLHAAQARGGGQGSGQQGQGGGQSGSTQGSGQSGSQGGGRSGGQSGGQTGGQTGGRSGGTSQGAGRGTQAPTNNKKKNDTSWSMYDPNLKVNKKMMKDAGYLLQDIFGEELKGEVPKNKVIKPKTTGSKAIQGVSGGLGVESQSGTDDPARMIYFTAGIHTGSRTEEFFGGKLHERITTFQGGMGMRLNKQRYFPYVEGLIGVTRHSYGEGDADTAPSFQIGGGTILPWTSRFAIDLGAAYRRVTGDFGSNEFIFGGGLVIRLGKAPAPSADAGASTRATPRAAR